MTASLLRHRLLACWSVIACAVLLMPAALLAQSPWERAATNLELSFTGPLARSLALVAIVLGGLTLMFGDQRHRLRRRHRVVRRPVSALAVLSADHG
jgi:type IV secretory pathway VirB2 component (pilin)